MDKETCRLEMRERLNQLDKSELSKKSRNLSHNLSNYLQNFDLSSICIGVFSPIQYEPLWFIEFLTLKHINFAMVQIEEDRSLSFYSMPIEEIAQGVSLRASENILGKEVKPDVVLVPGVAFSKNLERLGRGGGYYDKYLSGFIGEKIGLCFEFQILDEIPVNDLDVAMNLIITDKEIYKERIIK